MGRKVAKVGAVKTERNRSRSERKVGVSCTCGLLVARGPGRGATSRIIPRRKEVAIPLAYPAPEKVRNRNSGAIASRIDGADPGWAWTPWSASPRAVRRAGVMRPDDLQGRLVQRAVGGQDARAGHRERLAPAGRHPTAGLLDEEAPGGEIPGRQRVLEVGAEQAHPDHGQVERGGPETADAVDLPPLERADGRQRRLHHCAPVLA